MKNRTNTNLVACSGLALALVLTICSSVQSQTPLSPSRSPSAIAADFSSTLPCHSGVNRVSPRSALPCGSSSCNCLLCPPRGVSTTFRVDSFQRAKSPLIRGINLKKGQAQ